MTASLFGTRIRWQKLGLIFRPRSSVWWMRTHAMVPTPEHLNGSVYRVYFSGRDERGRSHIGYVVLDLLRPTEPLDVSDTPVLAPGELGCFDDNGVTPSCIVRTPDKTHLYYIGWNPGSTVRVHLFGGLALSAAGSTDFTRYSRAPIIERTALDPFMNTAPFVLRDGHAWRMYYVAGVGWPHKDLPRYHIRSAVSTDGLAWDRRGHVCVDFAFDGENALARPWVVQENGIYRMWFAHKGEAYQLGYAESLDGLAWIRDDSFAGIKRSEADWDAEMVEYAAVVTFEGQHFMFYNGNGYGRDGFGMAQEE